MDLNMLKIFGCIHESVYSEILPFCIVFITDTYYIGLPLPPMCPCKMYKEPITFFPYIIYIIYS